MYFSENLTKLRKGKGWSQEDLADKLDISRQAVSKWEVGTSKPDIDNLMKLSKLFSKPIDELVNNKIVHTEAMSIVVKKRDFKHDLLLWLRGLIVLLIVLLVIDTIYKFTMLFIITMGEQKYKQLDNYHYVITKYDNDGIREKEESWYKEGVSKTISTSYLDNVPEQTITYIDYNKKLGFVQNVGDNTRSNINIEEHLQLYPHYYEGGRLYAQFPKEISKKNLLNIICTAINSSAMKIDTANNEILLNIGNSYIRINSKTFLPISTVYMENTSDKYWSTYFNIDINNVGDIII